MAQEREKILEWCAYNPVFFEKYKNVVKAFEQIYFGESCNWKEILKNGFNVLSNCDEISFDENEVDAYSFLHFLDRYHRFQKIFTKIYARGYFPTPKNTINVLDIGTGPGPSIYALNDFISILKKYGSLYQNSKLASLNIEFEYLERSNDFKRWITKFHESLASTSNQEYLINLRSDFVSEFEGLNIQGIKANYRQWLIDRIEDEFYRADEYVNGALALDMLEPQWKYAYRYNILIMSNFITKLSQIEQYSKEIISAVYALRNNGIFILVTGTSLKYETIISEIKNLLLHRSYNTKKVRGKLNFVIKKEIMEFNLQDYFGIPIINNIKRMCATPEYESLENTEFKRIFNRTLSNGHTNKWYLTVFKKQYSEK